MRIAMTNSNYYDNITKFFTSLVQGLRADFSHPIDFLQIGAIRVSYLIARLLAAMIHQYLGPLMLAPLMLVSHCCLSDQIN